MQSLANLSDVDPAALMLALADQRPTTIALVLRHLPSDRAPQIVSKLDPQKRQAVVKCLSSSVTADPQVVRDVARGLAAKIRQLTGSGTLRAVKILDQCERLVEESILESLESTDGKLAHSIRQAQFGFTDIRALSGRAAKTLIRNVKRRTWALALKESDKAVRRKIDSNLTTHAIGQLSDEMDYLTAASDDESKVARATIVDVARGVL